MSELSAVQHTEAGHCRISTHVWVSQVALGQVLHQVDELLPANSLPWDDIFAAVLLVFFGIKTLLVSHPDSHTLPVMQCCPLHQCCSPGCYQSPTTSGMPLMMLA